MRARITLALVAAGALLAGCGGRAPTPAPTPSATAAAADAAPQTEAMRAYADAARKMHGAMASIDRDPDVAFVRGMIPHHQGAIDMARIELKYGADPELRALAEQVIAAQTREIADMEAWLKRRGAAPAAPAGHMGH